MGGGMQNRTHHEAPRGARWFLIIALLAASACVPVAFRPARTVAPGEFEHAPGVMAFRVDSLAEVARDRDSKEGLPGGSYQLRYGAAQGLDVGLGVATLGAVTAEATIELFRSELVDVALGTSFACDFVDVVLPALATPILVDLNLGRAVSVVAYAAPVAYWPMPEDERLTRWMFQAGAGLDLRATSWLSVRPYAGVLGPIGRSSDEGLPIPFAGVGFGIGGSRGF